jgi:hypothetical protein
MKFIIILAVIMKFIFLLAVIVVLIILGSLMLSGCPGAMGC